MLVTKYRIIAQNKATKAYELIGTPGSPIETDSELRLVHYPITNNTETNSAIVNRLETTSANADDVQFWFTQMTAHRLAAQLKRRHDNTNYEVLPEQMFWRLLTDEKAK